MLKLQIFRAVTPCFMQNLNHNQTDYAAWWLWPKVYMKLGVTALNSCGILPF